MSEAVGRPLSPQSGRGGISIESAFALEVTKKDFW